MVELIIDFKNFFWSVPLLFMLVLVGLYQTWTLRGLQLRYLFHAIRLTFRSSKKKVSKTHVSTSSSGELTSFQALMTALAGAVGTGNITGIAIALTIGGYGALFWMWVIALLGMVTAYSEAVLAIKFRTFNKRGSKFGGPMQTLSSGLGMKKTAASFAFFCMLASFGIGGTIQSSSVAAGVDEIFGIEPIWTGLVLSFLTACVILGGVKSIGKAAGILVPCMALMYIGAGLVVLVLHWDKVPTALLYIFKSAFSGHAATGAFLGATAIAAIQQGVSNGIFANEAGLGSLSLAAATADTDQPSRQGMLAISGVFIATILICSMTGLVIAVTDVLGKTTDGGELMTGSALTISAFNTVHPNFGYVVIVGLVLFAFTSILAWSHYGEKCVEFLFGKKISKYYRFLYSFAVFCGPLIDIQLIWAISNLANGFMAVPNLISILRLSPVVKSETEEYLSSLRA